MPKDQIVIDIERGIVSVYASAPERLEVSLVDWVSQGVDPRSPNMVQVQAGRHTLSAFIQDVPVETLSELAGGFTERAIELACEQGALVESQGGIPC